jgi:osmotically-inducible protein OsmY
MKTKKTVYGVTAAVVAFFLVSGPLFSNAQDTAASGLKKHVMEAYYRHYQNPIDISVPEPGTVMLKGGVDTYWDKLNIFAIMAKVNGVTNIINELTVSTDPVPNNIIRDEIMHEYELNRLILEPKNINIKVNDGMVLLTGTVSFYKEARAAEDIASWCKGVKSVDNALNVLSPVKAESDSNLTAVVRDVLKDEFPLGTEKVRASVTQGVVALTGTVENYWLKHSMEKELRGILGVRDVKDQTIVKPQI